MAGEGFRGPTLLDQQHVVGLELGALLHTGRTDRHAWDREADRLRPLGNEAFDVGPRHMAFDDIPSIMAVWQEASLSPMPACRFSAASALGSAAFTSTVKPFTSRCLTQAPQHLQVADFQTSIEGSVSAALAGATPKTIRKEQDASVHSFCRQHGRGNPPRQLTISSMSR